MINKIVDGIEVSIACDENDIYKDIAYIEQGLVSTRDYIPGQYIYVESTNTLYKVLDRISPSTSLINNYNVANKILTNDTLKEKLEFNLSFPKDLGWYTIAKTSHKLTSGVAYLKVSFSNRYFYKYPSINIAEVTFGYDHWGKVLSANTYVCDTRAEAQLCHKIRIVCNREASNPSYASDLFSIQLYRGYTASNTEPIIITITDQLDYYSINQPIVDLYKVPEFYSTSDTPLTSADVICDTKTFTISA